MKNEEMQNLTNRIQEKIGEENSALISDDLAILLSDTQNVNQNYETQNQEIQKLKQEKENLINTNGKLLQQVSMSIDKKDEKEDKKETYETINFYDCFDEKGNFI